MCSNSFVGSLLRQRLRAALRGVIEGASRDDAVTYVVDPRTGLPVLPVHADVAELDSVVLFVPDRAEGGTQWMGAPVRIDPSRHAAVDVHQACFGPTTLPHWITIDVEAVKFAQGVVDAGEVIAADPLAAQVPALCRMLNAEPSRLEAACEARLGVRGQPRAVNVDASGVTLRANFDLLRLEFPEEVLDAAGAPAAVEALLAPSYP